MAPTFFSIVITSLNPGGKLLPTLESVLEQDYGHYEIIIKDGESTDGSFVQLADGSWGVGAFGTAPDSRIRIYRQADRGIYDGMNQALTHVRGQYVLFLNCGDLLYDKSVLIKTARFIEKREAQSDVRMRGRPRIFYGDLFNQLQNSPVHSVPKLDDFACYRNVPCHQVCFYNAQLFADRGYDTDFRVRADYEHFLYCIYEKKAEAVYMPVTVALYEGGGFSETPENRRRSALEHRIITRYYLGRGKSLGYRLIMLATLAPLRTRIAEDPRLSAGYNALKSAVYDRMGGKKNGGL